VPVAVIPETSGRRRHGVVVGIDDSPAGRAAIHFGAAEAFRTGDSLRLVAAWKLPDSSHDDFHHDERREAGVRAMLETESARVREEFPTLEVHSRIIRLPAAEALVDASASASLVVLGNSGPISDSQGLLGSVAHDVLVNLAGPTVIVHAEKAHRHSPRESHKSSSDRSRSEPDSPADPSTDSPADPGAARRNRHDDSHGLAEFAEA